QERGEPAAVLVGGALIHLLCVLGSTDVSSAKSVDIHVGKVLRGPGSRSRGTPVLPALAGKARGRMFQLSEAASRMSANRAEVGGDIRGDELELGLIGHVEELKVDSLGAARTYLLEPIDRFDGGTGDPCVAQLLRVAADGLRPLHEFLLGFADAYDERGGIGEFVR